MSNQIEIPANPANAPLAQHEIDSMDSLKLILASWTRYGSAQFKRNDDDPAELDWTVIALQQDRTWC